MNGDREVGRDEHHHLSDVDDLVRVDVTNRLEHHERDVAVNLQLGTLVGMKRILDSQRMQLKLGGQRIELRSRRLIHLDPHEPIWSTLGALQRSLQRQRTVLSDAVPIQRAVHDHRMLTSFAPASATKGTDR
jgi:hypothetical protein